ncbi:MAG: LUD domain-containing protein [Capnocytophaga sp.]|nr:LUD domain-containing protein [Capnocytophaga sp.]
MSWLEKLFKNSKQQTKEDKKIEINKKQVPVDEVFVNNLKKNGGIFIYCESISEIVETIGKIVAENVKNIKLSCYNDYLKSILPENYFRFFTNIDAQATFFLTDCEYLLANDGSVMFSSKQLGSKQISELPPSLIVVAKASQIVGNIGDGMKGIMQRPKEERPENIRSIKNFQTKEKDTIMYGSCSRKLYLLLLEDLN